MPDEMSVYYLHPGRLVVRLQPGCVRTVLGSCVAVCLWDPVLGMGGMNHFQMPLWSGEGLPSPRFGNIAVQKLIEQMLQLGSRKADLQAKVFGGASVLENTASVLDVGRRNIIVARDELGRQSIPIVGHDVGGQRGRRLVLDTATGKVLLKKLGSFSRRVSGPSRPKVLR